MVAALVVLGIAVPSIGALLKPFITEAVFLLLCVAFVLVDTAAFRSFLRRPTIVLAATAWTSLAVPALSGASFLALGLDDRSPDLFLALARQGIASPLMAAPAFAALTGLDATLALCTMVASTALLPITAPVFAYAFIGPALTLSPSALGLKLLLLQPLARRMIAERRRRPHHDDDKATAGDRGARRPGGGPDSPRVLAAQLRDREFR